MKIRLSRIEHIQAVLEFLKKRNILKDVEDYNFMEFSGDFFLDGEVSIYLKNPSVEAVKGALRND